MSELTPPLRFTGDPEKTAKRQKRARHDIRTAWRHLTPDGRAEFLTWAFEEDKAKEDRRTG